MGLVFSQPFVEVKIVELLCPQHSRQSLTLNAFLVLAQRSRCDAVIKLVGFRLTSSECFIKCAECISGWLRAQSQPHHLVAPGGHCQPVVRSAFGANLRWIH